eukprot:GDKJ01019383.1.p1 GENE.GDKJ01019383.1~~GDKJ01019383.1.p1  ORF type:complete len:353 (-),score=82.91 GDKJ01019383.1:36-1004(-)
MKQEQKKNALPPSLQHLESLKCDFCSLTVCNACSIVTDKYFLKTLAIRACQSLKKTVLASSSDDLTFSLPPFLTLLSPSSTLSARNSQPSDLSAVSPSLQKASVPSMSVIDESEHPCPLSDVHSLSSFSSFEVNGNDAEDDQEGVIASPVFSSQLNSRNFQRFTSAADHESNCSANVQISPDNSFGCDLEILSPVKSALSELHQKAISVIMDASSAVFTPSTTPIISKPCHSLQQFADEVHRQSFCYEWNKVNFKQVDSHGHYKSSLMSPPSFAIAKQVHKYIKTQTSNIINEDLQSSQQRLCYVCTAFLKEENALNILAKC